MPKINQYTENTKIHLGRRIAEIMKQKGRAFTQQAVATRLDYCLETLRLMLVGKREIYYYELEKIAGVLKLPIQRITEEDITEKYVELVELQRKEIMPDKSLELAKSLVSVALGITEKCDALHKLGCAYFDMRHYEEAHDAFLEAHELALQIAKKYPEIDLLFSVLRNLADSYAARKDYFKAMKIINEVEHIFSSTSQRSAALYFIKAQIISSMGDDESAKEFSLNSLMYCEVTGKQSLIGIAELNLAHYEYRLNNFSTAKKLLQQSYTRLVDDTASRVIVAKELIKNLIKLGEVEDAVKMVDETMDILKSNQKMMNSSRYVDIAGKLLILQSKATNDPSFAEEIMESHVYSSRVKYLSCQFLKNFYRRTDDIERFMTYYDIAEGLDLKPSDVLDEEDM